MDYNLKKLVIDIGSSTMKAYLVDKYKISLIAQRSVHFQADILESDDISEKSKKELISFIDDIHSNYSHIPIKLYATGIFRTLKNSVKVQLIDEVYVYSKLFLNIISHELENFYLEKALIGKCSLTEPILLMNIGGGSTELVFIQRINSIDRHNIKLGVRSINSKFNKINEKYSGHHISEIISYVKTQLPNVKNTPKYIIYNGGELTYMKLTGYKLETNTLFVDPEHPYMISIENMRLGNTKVFSELSLMMLQGMMPHDPKWMNGARACSAIAQAVCEKYGINLIIPSDSNMVHGIVIQEVRSVTISGSYRKHLENILETKRKLESKGIVVLSPRLETPKNPCSEFIIFEGEEALTPLQLERIHLESIVKADALVVCNKDGYVGASALLEIGFALSLCKRIIFTEKPNEYILSVLPTEYGLDNIC